ncbi:MAG: 4Fe-4S dicluster domain-containing protein [Thermodesulfobacteriota bacterium]
MEQIVVDPDRCTGCRSCELGCAVRHSKAKTLLGAISESPLPRKRLFVETFGGRTGPVICRHCADAPCVKSCISGCLYHDERGFVRRRKERCIGCWSCVAACPFGVITPDPVLGLAVKCDRCHKSAMPACVEACPTGALTLADLDAVAAAARRQVLAAEAGQKKGA